MKIGHMYYFFIGKRIISNSYLIDRRNCFFSYVKEDVELRSGRGMGGSRCWKGY